MPMTVEGLRQWLAELPKDHMIYGAIAEPLIELFERYDQLLAEAGAFVVRCRHCGLRAEMPGLNEEQVFETVDAHLAICEKHPMRRLEADIKHAVAEAKRRVPDYPWQQNTAAEAVWALGLVNELRSRLEGARNERDRCKLKLANIKREVDE